MTNYRVTFTASYDCIVEAEDPRDACSEAHIPDGCGANYITDSFEVIEVEEMEVKVHKGHLPDASQAPARGESPYAIRSKVGDRFFVDVALGEGRYVATQAQSV